MRVFSAAEVDGLLAFPPLIDALAEAFRGDMVVPVRHHHAIERPDAQTAMMLLMPAWTAGASPGFLGTKVVNVFPDNSKRGLPSVHGSYLLMSGDTGVPLAVMDGARLTLWRTAAASALASRFLSRADARRLTMVGAGALAPFLIRAHAAVRPIDSVRIWNHRPERAHALAATLAAEGIEASVAPSLETAVRDADIISCATLSKEPVVRGQWLSPGTHLDLVGAYTPAMRESDDDAVLRARVFVDTFGGALKEAGDIVQPLAAGIVPREHVLADLFALCRGTFSFERKPSDITLFKSVGTAIEDLAAAMLVYRSKAG